MQICYTPLSQHCIVDVLDVDYYQHQDFILKNFDFQIDVDYYYYQNQDIILISSSRAVNPPMRPCGVVVLLKPSVTPNNLYIDNLHF